MSEVDVDVAASFLHERWVDTVERVMGPEHTPDPHIGTDFRLCNRAEYISKLGLEITDARAKKRAHTKRSRTPFQILQALANTETDGDVALWREYATATKGHRFLGWSTGLKPWRKLVEAEVAEGLAAELETIETAAVIDGPTWDAVRRAYQENRECAAVRVLEIAEKNSPDAAKAWAIGECARIRAVQWRDEKGFSHDYPS